MADLLNWMTLFGLGLIVGGLALVVVAVVAARRGPAGSRRPRRPRPALPLGPGGTGPVAGPLGTGGELGGGELGGRELGGRELGPAGPGSTGLGRAGGAPARPMPPPGPPYGRDIRRSVLLAETVLLDEVAPAWATAVPGAAPPAPPQHPTPKPAPAPVVSDVGTRETPRIGAPAVPPSQLGEAPLARPYVDATHLANQSVPARTPRPGYQNQVRHQPQPRQGQPPPNQQRSGRPGWAPIDPAGPYPNAARSAPPRPAGPPANGPRLEPLPGSDGGADRGRPVNQSSRADGPAPTREPRDARQNPDNRQAQDAGKRTRRRRPGR